MSKIACSWSGLIFGSSHQEFAGRKIMNNPGLDLTIWEQLKQKWDELDRNGHSIKIDFKLIVDKDEEDKTLAIDVIQKIDDEFFTETVQHEIGEGYEPLGIDSLSLEQLVEVYKEKLHQLHKESNMPYAHLVVTMTPYSSSSGETQGYLEKRNKNQKRSVPVDYQHYYLLNAIRDKMIDLVGEGWRQVKAVYWKDALQFYFEY